MNGSSSESKTRDMDWQLAGLGYKARSSELCQVAENMEHLENVINTVNSSRDISQVVAFFYDPSNIGLGSWVDRLLSQTCLRTYNLSSDLPDLSTDLNRQLGMVTTFESTVESTTISCHSTTTMSGPSVFATRVPNGV
ncbi:hypothetical protein V8G54_010657 [Vigna mungo]|uniref:Transcriptional factor DELLA N-terminal domain-containing protein n=1 Tax=Vigna mungo TaxID=3915 RepID=A0AAQ3NXH9_VIGMU